MSNWNSAYSIYWTGQNWNVIFTDPGACGGCGSGGSGGSGGSDGQSPPDPNDNKPKCNYRGRYVRRACENCKKRHIACSNKRPCPRCVQDNVLCVDAETKTRGRPKGSKNKPKIAKVQAQADQKQQQNFQS